MLWKITGTDVHLVGTVHMSDRPVDLGQTISPLVDQAQVVAFETNWDAPQHPKTGMQKKGKRLSDSIPPDLVADTKLELAAINFEGDPEAHEPWDLALKILGARSQEWGFIHQGVDHAVRARMGSKAQLFLEPVGASLSAFGSGPLHEQITMLDSAVRRQVEGRALIIRLVSAWWERRIEDCRAISIAQHAALPTIMSNVITARNAAWLPQITRLARGNKRAVVAVGLLHFVGSKGLPEMLGDAGLECIAVPS